MKGLNKNLVQSPRVRIKIRPIKLNRETRPKKLKVIRSGRKKRRRSTRNVEKVVSQLQEVIPSLLLERNKKTLVKLLTLAIIKKAITQKIALDLSQKTSCSLNNLHSDDC